MGWTILAAAAAIFVIIIAINRIVSASAYAALKVPGDLIKISDGSTVHAVSTGEGKYTMVMLSGWGTACPCADFHDLAERIAKHCRVIILELADMFVTVQQARYANRTQTAEMSGVFRDIKGSLKGQKYDESLYVVNMLATEKGKTDEQMRQAWGFTWKEAHEELVTNPAIQKTVDMQGARHYIHHTHAAEMEKLAAELITELEKSA